MSGVRDHAVYLVTYTVMHSERVYTEVGMDSDYYDKPATRVERQKRVFAPNPAVAAGAAMRYEHEKPELVKVESLFVLDHLVVEHVW